MIMIFFSEIVLTKRYRDNNNQKIDNDGENDLLLFILMITMRREIMVGS